MALYKLCSSKTKKVFASTLSVKTWEANIVDKSFEYPVEELTLPCQGSRMIKEGEDKEMTVESVCSIDLTNFGEDENAISQKEKI